MTSVKKAPEVLLALLQQAIVLHNQQKLDEADAIYVKVLARAPRHADALHLRALICHARDQFAEAARFAQAAIAVAPQVANFQNTAGEAWRRLGRLDLALKYLQQAIRLEPSMAMAYLNLSLALSGAERHEEALAAVSQALLLQPDHAEALAQALSIYCATHDEAKAASLAGRLGRIEGNRVAAQARGRYHNYLARSHLRDQCWDEAAEETERAMALYPQFWANWALMAEMSNEALDFSNAELYCTIAANLAPDNEDARLNVGHVLLEQKRLEEAESHYAGWLDGHPESAAARFGLASVNLLRGNFELGWRYYEARWGLRRHGGGERIGAVPAWDGRPCAHLLLYAEQGLGDTIQMLRFLPQVLRCCGGKVTLQVPAPLLRLARRAAGAQQIEVVSELAPQARGGRACPLMSLPHLLRAHSSAELAMAAPYIVADERRRMFFERALAALKGKKIGIVWQGGASGLTNRRRPFPLDALAPLRAIPGIALVSLQFGVTHPMIGALPITDLSGHIADFDDLAAAMMALDAVISVDTGPAHLAGALGVPTFTLVPWLHDWRWGIDGGQSCWYPGMRLIRQAGAHDWSGAVQELIACLVPAHAAPRAPSTAPAFPGQRAIASNLFPQLVVNASDGQLAAPLFDPRGARSLLVYGEYMQVEAALAASFLRAGDTVLELGAGIGVMTIGAARAVGPAGRVVAFESDPQLRHCCAQSLQLGGIGWAEVRPQALDVVAPDSLGLGACALIRIDAPAQAFQLLEGARALIGSLRPVIWLARVDPATLASLPALLRHLGYRAYRLDAPMFRPHNRRHCPIDVFAGPAAPSVLALAPGAAAPPRGAIEL